MHMVLSVIIAAFLLFGGFAQAEPMYPSLSATNADGEVTQSEWNDNFWLNIFYGNQYENIAFHDPDTNTIMHNVRINFGDDGRPSSILIDGRLEFSLVKYNLRINKRARELKEMFEEIEADNGYVSEDINVKDTPEYEQIVLEETQKMIIDYYQYLNKSLSYFHAQNYLSGDDSILVNIQNMRRMRRHANVLNFASLVLLPISTILPLPIPGFPDPFSIYGSRRLSIEARRKLVIAHEIMRRIEGEEYQVPSRPLSSRLWRLIEVHPKVSKLLNEAEEKIPTLLNWLRNSPSYLKSAPGSVKSFCERKLMGPAQAVLTSLSAK